MNAGMGVMLGMLRGNEETVNAVKGSLGKQIEYASLEDNELRLKLTDGQTLVLFDDGQSCCEHRYMVTDDDLKEYSDSKLINIEIKEAPEQPDEWGTHEVQFLEVTTDKGSFVLSNHNEHNGYYGGFWIVATIRS